MPEWPNRTQKTAPGNQLGGFTTTPLNSGLRKARSFENWPSIANQQPQSQLPKRKDNPLVVVGEILLGAVIGLVLVGVGDETSIPLVNEISQELESAFGSDLESTALYVIVELLEALLL